MQPLQMVATTSKEWITAMYCCLFYPIPYFDFGNQIHWKWELWSDIFLIRYQKYSDIRIQSVQRQWPPSWWSLSLNRLPLCVPQSRIQHLERSLDGHTRYHIDLLCISALAPLRALAATCDSWRSPITLNILPERKPLQDLQGPLHTKEHFGLYILICLFALRVWHRAKLWVRYTQHTWHSSSRWLSAPGCWSCSFDRSLDMARSLTAEIWLPRGRGGECGALNGMAWEVALHYNNEADSWQKCCMTNTWGTRGTNTDRLPVAAALSIFQHHCIYFFIYWIWTFGLGSGLIRGVGRRFKLIKREQTIQADQERKT